jgi:hypothetical protein
MADIVARAHRSHTIPITGPRELTSSTWRTAGREQLPAEHRPTTPTIRPRDSLTMGSIVRRGCDTVADRTQTQDDHVVRPDHAGSVASPRERRPAPGRERMPAPGTRVGSVLHVAAAR